MAQMTAVQVSNPGGVFEVVKRTVPEPGPNTVVSRFRLAGSVIATPL
jgi:hypothetical protein